jgi:hypothetical protein
MASNAIMARGDPDLVLPLPGDPGANVGLTVNTDDGLHGTIHATRAGDYAEEGDHHAAAKSHLKAAMFHDAQALAARKDGNRKGAKDHDEAAALHRKLASDHLAANEEDEDEDEGATANELTPPIPRLTFNVPSYDGRDFRSGEETRASIDSGNWEHSEARIQAARDAGRTRAAAEEEASKLGRADVLPLPGDLGHPAPDRLVFGDATAAARLTGKHVDDRERRSVEVEPGQDDELLDELREQNAKRLGLRGRAAYSPPDRAGTEPPLVPPRTV